MHLTLDGILAPSETRHGVLMDVHGIGTLLLGPSGIGKSECVLDLVERDLVYQVESPTMWDIDFKTAVAQAEVEDRPRQGFFYDLRFAVDGGGDR